MSQISHFKQIYDMFANLNIDHIDMKSEEGNYSFSFGNDQNEKNKALIPVPNICPRSDSIELEDPLVIAEKYVDIKSPGVGIFERANPKTKEYYIKLRDTVKKNQVIGHVSVLGILHDVISPVSGKIIEILIENEQPIEYGQPIMRLESNND